MKSREIILGVTGGVAAYKAAALTSQLVQAGYGVSVVLTKIAQEFVGKPTFAALSGRPVETKIVNSPNHVLGPHIELARRGELLCIAPATANFLAKAAHGVADDLLSTLYLAFSGPVLMAPAMNNEMWSKPAVQRNVAQLKEDGVEFVDPVDGWLSCRQVGPGRMADPEVILAAIEKRLSTLKPRTA